MKRTNYSLSREDILTEAYEKCMRELYKKSQPSGDYDEYINKIKSGEITKEELRNSPIYNRHYLSSDELNYIVKKYHKAYRMDNEFKDSCNILLDDMKKKVPVDKYIEEHDDEYGHHPGYRGYEDRPPMKERILNTLAELDIDTNHVRWSEERFNEIAEKITKTLEDFIIERRDFYMFDRDGQKFNNTVYLGCSPTSDKNAVINYWKEHGKDIEIVDRDPEKLWYIDEGWTDEEIEEEFNPRDVFDEE